MGLITAQNLKVFRGTYNEVMEQPTEDGKVYLAWDTQEFYVGNKYGTKVRYGYGFGIAKQENPEINKAKEELLKEIEILKNRVDKLEAICVDQSKEISRTVSYKTGNQIKLYESSPSMLTPTICTKDSDDGKFIIGEIYYYDGEKISNLSK